MEEYKPEEVDDEMLEIMDTGDIAEVPEDQRLDVDEGPMSDARDIGVIIPNAEGGEPEDE